MKITIGKKEVEYKECEISQQELSFYVDNPRVYTTLRDNGCENPTQGEIEKLMRASEHVKELKEQIKQNGGLIEPLIVVPRNNEYIVIEGNSRLAAYRILADKQPIEWGKVRCNILSADVTDDDIDILLGTYHLVTKKDWSKFEKAAYLYRMKKRDDSQIDTLARKTGLSVGSVKKYLKIYDFMVKNKDTVQNHWNDYEQYVGSKSFDKYRDTYPELDDLMVKKIKSGEIKQAKDIRDKLAPIAKSSGKASARIMRDFIDGNLDIDEAFTRFVATGRSGENYSKLKEFRTLITSDDFVEHLEAEAIENKNIAFELRKINTAAERIINNLKKADK